MTFQEMTDELLKCFTAAEIAERIGCSVGAVKQARLQPGTSGYRSPPPGWEKALKELARERGGDLLSLAGDV